MALFPQVFQFDLIYRYFSVINLNENKKNIYHSLKLGGKINAFTKAKSIFLKLISSTWFTLIMIGLTYFVIVIIYVILLGSYGFVCRFETLVAIRWISNLELCLIYVLIMITLFGDLIPNYSKVLRCHWIDYIFNSDPYWFRAQIILFFPFMIYSLAAEIYMLATSSTFEAIVLHYRTHSILNTVNAHILLVLEVAFPLVLTIITILKKLKKQPLSNPIETILEDVELRKMFADHSALEFSLENVVAWQDLVQYKTSPDRERFALEIFEKFLNGSQSVMEINIPGTMSREIWKKIELKEFSDDLFKPIVSTLNANMADTFSRFGQYPPYQNYLANNKKVVEMVEGK